MIVKSDVGTFTKNVVSYFLLLLLLLLLVFFSFFFKGWGSVSWSNKEEPVSWFSNGGCLAIVRPWSDQEGWTFKPSLFLTFTLGTTREKGREREREGDRATMSFSCSDRSIELMDLVSTWTNYENRRNRTVVARVRCYRGNNHAQHHGGILYLATKLLKNWNKEKKTKRKPRTLDNMTSLNFLLFTIT